MPYHWNTKDVLEIVDLGRCVGHADSKGRKCSYIIKRDNVKRMDNILAEMGTQSPDPELLRPKLRELAGHGLCIRQHQDQINKMVETWSERIRASYPTPSPRVSSQSEEIQTLTETICSLRRILQEAQQRLDALQSLSRPSRSRSTISRVSTAEISSLDLSQEPAVQSNPTGRSRASTVTSTTVTQPSTPILAPQHSPLSDIARRLQNISISTTSRCTQTHVRRLPIDESCPVCYDDEAPLLQSDTVNVVWCKNGCGKSMHAECLDLWTETRIDNNQEAACPCCRADWEDDCEC